ncbi:MAG: tetratricopeptide repeat protein [candidate division KSB1 bacterium]
MSLKRRFYLSRALFFALCLILGCQSTSEQQSQAEEQRRVANPRAPKFLIQAQDALSYRAFAAALALTDSAEHYAPQLADVFFLRGVIHTEMRRYDLAEAAYQKVLALDPFYKGAWLNLGSVALRAGESRKALQCYQKEMANYPGAAALHQMGRVYAKLGKPDSARFVYEQALKSDSAFTTAYLRLAELYKEEGELDQALKYARRGLQLEPDNLNYQYFIGALLVSRGDLPEAVAQLENVVRKRPWHYWANYNLGQAFVRMNRPAEGKSYLAKAESLQVELKNIQDWENLVENNPDQLMLWVNYGEALRRAGRWEEAREAFQVALSIEPRFMALENNLANLYILTGDTAKAIFHYESIVARAPMLTEAWLNLGVAHANAKHFEQARAAWENALKQAPEDSTVKVYLAKLPKQP